jgi:hypothetical protein
MFMQKCSALKLNKIWIYCILLTQCCSGDKIENNEMGWACITYGGGERRIQGFGGETLGKETTWEIQA